MPTNPDLQFFLDQVELIKVAMVGEFGDITLDQRIALFQCVLVGAILGRIPEPGTPPE